MLRPNKYTNVNISLIAISCEILKIFKKNEISTYSELLNKIIYNKGIESKNVFLPALSFLFILGKVKYHDKSDIIEYIHENK